MVLINVMNTERLLYYTQFKSGDTTVDVPEHCQDEVKKGMNYEES